jgi:hypothetical protein
VAVDEIHFWGADALPMLASYLQGDSWFSSPQWADARRPRAALSRP